MESNALINVYTCGQEFLDWESLLYKAFNNWDIPFMTVSCWQTYATSPICVE